MDGFNAGPLHCSLATGSVQVSATERTMYITDTQIVQILIAVVAVVAVAAILSFLGLLVICCHRRRRLHRRLDGHRLQSVESAGRCCDRRRWGLAQEAEAIIPKGEHRGGGVVCSVCLSYCGILCMPSLTHMRARAHNTHTKTCTRAYVSVPLSIN